MWKKSDLKKFLNDYFDEKEKDYLFNSLLILTEEEKRRLEEDIKIIKYFNKLKKKEKITIAKIKKILKEKFNRGPTLSMITLINQDFYPEKTERKYQYEDRHFFKESEIVEILLKKNLLNQFDNIKTIAEVQKFVLKNKLNSNINIKNFLDCWYVRKERKKIIKFFVCGDPRL